MNIDMLDQKPTGTEKTDDGNYSHEQLDEMLEHFIMMKGIEADPQKLNMLKKHAQMKSKMMTDMFEKGDKATIRSIGDLKKVAQTKMMENSDSEE